MLLSTGNPAPQATTPKSRIGYRVNVFAGETCSILTSGVYFSCVTCTSNYQFVILMQVTKNKRML